VSRFDEILEIANTIEICTTTTQKACVKEITESDMVQHRRLKIDVRKWILSKLMPKKYGDTSQMQTGEAVETYQPPKIEVVISQSVVDSVLNGN